MQAISGTWQRFAVVFLAIATLGATPSDNFTATTIMPVKMEIVLACSVSASDLNFGAIASKSQAPVLGQTSIQLNCGAGTTVEISLDAGTGPGRNTSRRRMEQESGTDQLHYGLYQNPGRTIHWGDRSGRDTLEVLTTGASQTVPIYGEIPAGQRVRDGTYSDMITITVNY